MRILIVGGGVAGLTLAALLRQRGEEPTVVERAEEYGRAGYLISLWPMGNRVLRGLGLYGGFQELSVPLKVHVLRDGSGKLIRASDVGARMDRYGEIRTLERADLVDLLRSHDGGIPVRMGLSIEHLRQEPNAVQVIFSDGTENEFDLVVGADGVDSGVRKLLLGEVDRRYTGYVLYWWWEEAGESSTTEINDFWGAGRLLGLYSGKKRMARYAMLREEEAQEASSTDTVSTSTVVSGRDHAKQPAADLVEERRALLRDRLAGFGGDDVRKILNRLDGANRIERLRLADLRAPRWHDGRTVLIGDAAATVLPVAGVGASLAMESAAVLADELSRTDARHLPNALRLYEQRRRKKTERLQNASRQMIRMPMVRTPALAAGRDALLRRLPEKMVAGDAGQMMERPI